MNRGILKLIFDSEGEVRPHSYIIDGQARCNVYPYINSISELSREIQFLVFVDKIKMMVFHTFIELEIWYSREHDMYYVTSRNIYNRKNVK